jgi:hypothetical protein
VNAVIFIAAGRIPDIMPPVFEFRKRFEVGDRKMGVRVVASPGPDERTRIIEAKPL